jgi:hypothetical protein
MSDGETYEGDMAMGDDDGALVQTMVTWHDWAPEEPRPHEEVCDLKLVAEYDEQSQKLTLFIDRMGYAAKRYAGIK